MALKDQQIQALLHACAETHDEEIDCDEFLARMASYAERRIEGGALPATLALVERHERLCADCRDECAALVAALTTESAEGGG